MLSLILIQYFALVNVTTPQCSWCCRAVEKELACQREQACCTSLTLLLKFLNPLPLCVFGFGIFDPIVFQICNWDEEICSLALRQPRAVNKHRRDTKGSKHACSMWLKDGLILVEKKSLSQRGEGGRVSSRTLLRVTPMCLSFNVYFLCVVCSVLCVKPREASHSSLPAPC